ncbi:DUF1501 domain-containing protein [Thalassoglobus polymorphus]|uniref:Sulfatase n=1 Tax=Thalassoglobus polymorphus TaxID=2527994 RepID=A0A517QGM0_9PLAN|nr:DUF1501 domain-containing protein [Thalassoglobus polymorphus]QDT30786.1 hypothetical protein Mal48_00130 [Thalassoglobus polymorphus]
MFFQPAITRSSLVSRREMLLESGTGFGALALASLLPQSALGDASASISHIAPRAKSVIFLFMEGGPSQMDLFDPKPQLNKLAGKPLPPGYKRVVTAMGELNSPLLASKRKWKQYGEAGTWVSDWIPNIAQCVDDMAVIRSCWTNGINHSGGVCQMNTGTPLAGRPSLGAWVNYGLGTENQNLPAFVVMTDNKAQVTNGPRNWGTGFMPASYQGTKLDVGNEPIANLNNPEGISVERQRNKLGLLNSLNRDHFKDRTFQTELEARIKSYELAFRMQANAPEAIDLESETAATQQLYGLDDPKTEAYGRNCLLARRLVERGVRFVQLYHGAGSKWDAHRDIEGNHTRMCGQSDKPVAGLIKDLKQRGLLDETLVVWGGEFGRTPMSEKGNGRDHNPTGFTMFMAGGGVAGGQTIGSTDDLGFHAVEDRLHVHDLHATILYLMGIDHMKLTYLHKGRPERPTQNEGDAYRLITQRPLVRKELSS